MKHLLAALLASLSLVVTVAAPGCTIEGDGATGKACATARDCPSPLTCVSARPVGRTCELLPQPAVGNFDTDAGVADWCTDIQPIMQAYCVECHAVPPTNSAPATFRLDVYASDPAGVPGAAEQAERIYVRTVVTMDMPPQGYPQPTPEERQAVTAWYRSGAPECLDGTTADAGM